MTNHTALKVWKGVGTCVQVSLTQLAYDPSKVFKVNPLQQTYSWHVRHTAACRGDCMLQASTKATDKVPLETNEFHLNSESTGPLVNWLNGLLAEDGYTLQNKSLIYTRVSSSLT